MGSAFPASKRMSPVLESSTRSKPRRSTTRVPPVASRKPPREPNTRLSRISSTCALASKRASLGCLETWARLVDSGWVSLFSAASLTNAPASSNDGAVNLTRLSAAAPSPRPSAPL